MFHSRSRRGSTGSRRGARFLPSIEPLESRLLMNADNPLAKRTLGAKVAAADFQLGPTSRPSVGPLPKSSTFRAEADLQNWILEAARTEYKNLFGQPQYSGGIVFGHGMLFHATANAAVDTNVQVQGVDEADLVETDDNYLYIISHNDLVIVQAGVGENLKVVSRIHLNERPTGMYLVGDRLALVSESFDYTTSGWGRAQTTVTVVNIADRTAPAIVQKTKLDGALVDTRTVNGELRMVVSNGWQLPYPILKPVPITPKVGPLSNPNPVAFLTVYNPNKGGLQNQLDAANVEYRYETEAEYLARVRSEFATKHLPQVRTYAADGTLLSQSALVTTGELQRPESRAYHSLTTIVTFDLKAAKPDPVGKATVFTGSNLQVYSTADNIYLFSDKPYDYLAIAWTPYVSKTNVWKFNVNSQSHAVQLAARGEFEGQLLNQFSADEHEGYLRVVSRAWGDQDLHVLQQVGDKLKLVGSVKDIAPGETLHSVRFEGDRAFVVTFRQVDPLFAIDLSNPTDPRILGELHIPGFSDYLQIIDANHAIGIGRDVDPDSNLFGDLQISLFDISDLTNPKLVSRFNFAGGRSTNTPVLESWQRGSHHALSYFADEGVLAIPVNSGGQWNNGQLVFEPGDRGLQLLKVDFITGFAPIGFIEHDSQILRSVEIGGRLYAISGETVTVHSFDNPETALGEVTINTVPPPELPDPGWGLPIIIQPWLPVRILPIETINIRWPLLQLDVMPSLIAGAT